MENWKDIKGYEGFYQVSDLGRVKSLERLVKNRNGFSLNKEKILKVKRESSGYGQVSICSNGIVKYKRVHQLVTESFLNHVPDGFKLVVNHINFDRADNRLENLEIVTARENSNQKHLRSSSQYTGVYFNKANQKWISEIRIDGKSKYLGSFANEYDAHLAYEKALIDIK